jgi:hypothetical protein
LSSSHVGFFAVRQLSFNTKHVYKQINFQRATCHQNNLCIRGKKLLRRSS